MIPPDSVKGKGREGKRREGRRGTGRVGEGSGGPQFTFLATPLRNGRSSLKIATTCLQLDRRHWQTVGASRRDRYRAYRVLEYSIEMFTVTVCISAGDSVTIYGAI